MEETLNWKELLAEVVHSWKQILVGVLAFTLLLGGYQGYKQYGLATNPENSQEKIEERYETALKDFETQKENLQKTLETQEKSLDSKEKYLEKSILLQIDPYNKYVASIVFTFSNIDESAQLFRYPNTAADYLPKKIRSQYIELWKSMDVLKDIGIAKYADVEWKYLSEIVSVTSLEGELVSIQAFGVTASDAEELVDAIYDYFDAHRSVIAAGSAQHSFALMNRTTKSVIDEDLNTKRENLEKEIEDLKTSIEDTKQSIEDLEEPTREEGYSTSVIIKAVAKYAALGAAAGMFFACFCVCFGYAFTGKVSSSYQLERVSEAPFFGSVRLSAGKMDRLAAFVMDERAWNDQEQADRYIREQMKANVPKEGELLLLSTLPEKKAAECMERVAGLLSQEGYTVRIVLDAAHNPELAEAVRKCTAVVFAEKLRGSRSVAVQNCAVQVKSAGKSVVGAIAI